MDTKPQHELPEVLVEDAERKWDAFKSSATENHIKLLRDHQLLPPLKRVFALSDFVAEACIRSPDMLQDLISSGDLQKSYLPNTCSDYLRAALCGTTAEDALCRILRHIRRREFVRIAWRDLCGWADLAETISDLSAFADACLDQCLDLLYQWQCQQYGVPSGPNGSDQKLVILALGKLGSRELNFSSDVDLVFAHPQNGATRGAEKSLPNDDFFARLCRRLIKVIGQQTADGFVFRVDLRLRPFGENGPLTMSFDAMERYFQEQGREWERYA